MPRAVFNLRNIEQHWGPPFEKEISDQQLVISEGQGFDNTRKDGMVFKLLRCNGDKALVEFSDKFTLKGHLHPRNRQVWVGKDNATDFTYLWGNDGMTKSLQLQEIIE